jgi:hypothetical protein
MMPEGHLSTFDLDALALGALAPERRAQAEAHLGACTRCQDDRDQARAAGERFLHQVFPRTLARVTQRRRRTARWLALGLALATTAAAVALLLVVSGRGTDPLDQGGPVVAAKGGPSFHVFAQRDGRVFAVADGARLRPGDELRFAVEPSGLAYLLVASVDGDGKVSVYYPFEGEESGRLAPGPRSELPDSIRLDQAAGPERLFALFSRAPLEAEPVRRALRGLGGQGPAAIRSRRALAAGAAVQLTLVFEKEVR